MKIKKIKTFLISSESKEKPHQAQYEIKKVLFLKVETDEGISGWGECYTQVDRETAVEAIVKSLSPYLIDRDPFKIKHFTFMAYRDFGTLRGSMELYSAISGIEIALWDIVGKSLKVPIYNLLGGASRKKILVYANGWYDKSSEETSFERQAKQSKEMVGKGYRALKFDPIPGYRRTHISNQKIETATKFVQAIREAVGPEIELFIEVRRRLDPNSAIRLADKITEFRPGWYEEPVSATDLDGIKEVRQKTNIPIVTGETLFTKKEFLKVFETRCADIINPDITSCGGILELKEIAAWAEPYNILVAPHNYNGIIGSAATMQVAATIPNFYITEYFENMLPLNKKIADNPIHFKDGYINLSDKPGLGVELNEKVLEAMAADFSLQQSKCLMPMRTLSKTLDQEPENYSDVKNIY